MKFFGNILTLLLLPATLFAQTPVEVSGRVTSVEDGKTVPVEGAVLLLKPTSLYAVTDLDGLYRFEKVEPGRYEMSVQMVGYVTLDSTVVVRHKSSNVFGFRLQESTFRLQEVNVVAQRSKAGDATASLISRQAIDHSQTSSLSELMQLLPGTAITNPDLSTSKSLTVRSASATSMNSLGTAIIMDGSPMSNNANMEDISSAMTGVSSTVAGTGTVDTGSVPNSGIDVRGISTDNIESIEVIRGIPSVQYGDMTSGAVIINSKAGAEPLTIRLKTDPKIYQVSASKGLKLGTKGGTVHVSGDYAYSNAKTTESYANYRRVNAKALYSKVFGQVSTTTSLEFRFGKDTRNANPDDLRTRLATGGMNVGWRFNTGGTWTVNKGWFKTLNYSLSNSFTYKESFKEQLCSNAMAVYSTNMVSGSTVSNIPGGHVYDSGGKEITNFTEDNGATAVFTPDSYFSHYDFYSKELNTFAKVTANFFKAFGENSDKIIAGADFKSDGNLGDGLIFPEGTPPMHSTHPESGYRSRPLYDVPFVNQLGLYAENTLKMKLAGRLLNFTAGARYDLVAGLSSIAPRINLSYEIIPDILSVRGGYGITSKAPTSSYLYPNNVYYDQSHYNNGMTGADCKVIATTYIFDSSNPELEIAKNRKVEFGVDLKIAGKYTLAITAYDELMKNGYRFGSSAASFALLPYRYYTADKDGQLVLTTDTNKFFNWYTPLNTAWEHNRGIEYELNLGRFEAIRTSFYLNGAWMLTETANSGYSYDFRYRNGSRTYSDVSVWDPFTSMSHYEKFINTLRITHNIPSLGFVVTLTTQFNAWTKNWTTYNNDEHPHHYISREDGLTYDFTDEMALDPSRSYMFDKVTIGRFTVSRTIPTVVFNLNVSKEIGNFLTASFYVNNLFNSRPLDPSETSKGVYSELNNPMYFGFELKLKL